MVLLLGGLLVILVLGYFALKAYLEREERPPRAKKEKKGTETPSTPEPRNEKSIDAIYAEKKHMWICPFCDTLNAKDAISCAACGKRR